MTQLAVVTDDRVKPEDIFTAEQLAAIHAAGLDVFYVRAEPLLFGQEGAR